MFGFRLASITRFLVAIFVAGATLQFATTDAEARAGRGGSRGRSAPSSSGYSQRSQPYTPPAAAPGMNTPMNPNRGGFMRNMAGGIAGGFLGSMLFSSLGQAAGGVGGAGGGGIGLLEIVLFAGIAFVVFRWWKSRKQGQFAFANASNRFTPSSTQSPSMGYASPISLAPAAALDSEAATDLFFKIQGAWTRRDLSLIDDMLGDEIRRALETDLADLRRNRHINRLENITVRRAEVTNSWQERGEDLATVRFMANLLDYTVDEATDAVVEGSNSNPVKFEEDWTFARSGNGQPWRLVGLQQVTNS